MHCAKTYISTTVSDPHCMHCKVVWNNSFLRSKFPQAWLNKDYKRIREKLLFDQEVAKIPETQKYCNAAKERESEKINRDDLSKTLKELKGSLNDMRNLYEECNQDIWLLKDDVNETSKVDKLKEKSHDLYKKKQALDENIAKITDKYETSGIRIWTLNNIIEGTEAVDKTDNFHLACPKIDCRGFISSVWKCGICDARICSDCREIQTDKHFCDEHTKSSVALLQKDTKPCPKCNCLIHKISGCDQMWCTQCRTAFSWDCGHIEHNVHNPHYYDWMRQNNQEIPRPVENNGHLELCGRFAVENNTFHIIKKIREIIDEPKKKRTRHESSQTCYSH